MNPACPRRSFLKSLAGLPLIGAATSFNIHVRAAEANNPFATDNPQITRARDVALSVLKPTPKQLEHGFRLHNESLVFESYGFAPRFAIDGGVIAAAMKSGASDEELIDLREEMSMSRGAFNARERKEFLDAFRAAGVTCIFQNTGEEGNDPMRLVKRLAHFTQATDHMRDDLFKAVKPDDIVAAKRDNRRCLYFTGNGVPLKHHFENTRDELQLIRLFHQLGIRMMHLTYNRRNLIGDGAGEPGDAGLSDFGHAVVAEMNRAGVIVDVAHSGWRTSHEAANASKKPMVASHTTCAGLYKHFRGKPDAVVKAICDTGGLIGICMIPRFLGANGDIGAFLDHIDYAVKKFGAEHVAIGPDISYVSRYDPEERAKIPPRANGRSPLSLPGARWEHLWPADDYRPKPHATASLAWTNWPLFTVGMVQRGHSDETIRKILGENALRVARANFAG
ncbi:MAG: membrane dipeptidase [Opitutaceae bacterium]|nr:membrane dipeptidase [Opitutaceae bacterium]